MDQRLAGGSVAPVRPRGALVASLFVGAGGLCALDGTIAPRSRSLPTSRRPTSSAQGLVDRALFVAVHNVMGRGTELAHLGSSMGLHDSGPVRRLAGADGVVD